MGKKSGFTAAQTGKQGEDFRKDLVKEQGDLISLYNAGQKEEYFSLLWDKLFVILKQEAMRYEQNGNYDDLFQSGAEKCMIALEAFNPNESMISTWFLPRIKGGMRDFNRGNGPRTEHYDTVYNKLNAIAREKGYEDCYAPGLDPVLLSIYSGIPVATVEKTLALGNMRVNSLDEMTEEDRLHPSSFDSSPEYMMLKKEEREAIEAALDTLNKLERYIITKLILEPKPVEPEEEGAKSRKSTKDTYRSVNEVTRDLQKPEVYEALGLKKPPSNNTVAQTREYALRKLKHAPSLKKQYKGSMKKRVEETAYEQIPLEELEEAIENGLLDLGNLDDL